MPQRYLQTCVSDFTKLSSPLYACICLLNGRSMRRRFLTYRHTDRQTATEEKKTLAKLKSEKKNLWTLRQANIWGSGWRADQYIWLIGVEFYFFVCPAVCKTGSRISDSYKAVVGQSIIEAKLYANDGRQ